MDQLAAMLPSVVQHFGWAWGVIKLFGGSHCHGRMAFMVWYRKEILFHRLVNPASWRLHGQGYCCSFLGTFLEVDCHCLLPRAKKKWFAQDHPATFVLEVGPELTISWYFWASDKTGVLLSAEMCYLIRVSCFGDGWQGFFPKCRVWPFWASDETVEEPCLKIFRKKTMKPGGGNQLIFNKASVGDLVVEGFRLIRAHIILCPSITSLDDFKSGPFPA